MESTAVRPAPTGRTAARESGSPSCSASTVVGRRQPPCVQAGSPAARPTGISGTELWVIIVITLVAAVLGYAGMPVVGVLDLLGGTGWIATRMIISIRTNRLPAPAVQKI